MSAQPAAHCAVPDPAAAVPVEEITPAWRLLATLGVSGAVSGLAIAALWTALLPRIDAHKSAELQAAVSEVLREPARSDTLFVVGGALTTSRPAGDAGHTAPRAYRGFDAAGAPIGYAIEAIGPGFSENIRLIYGYDHARGELIAMKILDSKETPGIADSAVGPQYVRQFSRARAPVVGVKASPKAADRGTVVMITGATISSRAIIRAINASLARWRPLITSYETSLSTAVVK